MPAKLRIESHLGIECGGTRAVALLVPSSGGSFQRAEFGPANLRLVDDRALARHFAAIKKFQSASKVSLAGIVIGMAGARTEADRRRIRAVAGKIWPGTPVYATNDLETALMAAAPQHGSRPRARVLILSGTGSCCFGRAPNGATLRLGGWGHLLGDNGSGYDIGLRALREVIASLDRSGKWPPLGAAVLRDLQMNEPNELINWVRNADKSEVAALAERVFEAAVRGDRIARAVLNTAAASLAGDGADCARRLAGPNGPVEFVLAGGILLKQPAFARRVAARLRSLRPGARVTPLPRESAWGAIELAREHFKTVKLNEIPPKTDELLMVGTPRRGVRSAQRADPTWTSTGLPPTERRNPRSRNLSSMPLAAAVKLMIDEDSNVGDAVLKERRKIEKAVAMIVRALRHGGRLFYAGAGTSGRLGILDASECPPTFRVPPDLVQGIIAGGQTAIWKSVEGAEDDPVAGASAVKHRGAGARDVVLGIAASGRTPFVWGALGEARRLGARTILLCFNPLLEIPPAARPDLVIAPDTGPEVLTGSTRLKAGTATKMILNTLTTLAMTRMGKVVGNLMVDVNASNQKLRDRATRIVEELTGATPAAARAALEKSNWMVRRACGKIQNRRGR